MNVLGVIIGICVWLFVDIFLGLKVKNVRDSDRKKGVKILLIGVNVLFALAAIMIALMI
tara:strand:+ start:142 stop:318 length:177 start_codon:yes stop_codon:yes gene_type:complete